MSEVEALDELRGLRDEVANRMVENPNWVCWRVEGIVDEIEAEIAERFMELPVDAYGVPIHVGDKVHSTANLNVGKVSSVAPKSVFIDCHSMSVAPGSLMHDKPDPVKDFLREFGDRVARSGHQWGLDSNEIIEEFSEKFKELNFDYRIHCSAMVGKVDE